MVLEEKLKNLPDQPGVYLMKDQKDQIIYVGKAINLKNRVRSYFSSQHPNSPKTRMLVSSIRDLDFIITDSEIEALILESNLIKKHKPKFNIRLIDDKYWPFLRVTINEQYPRLEITRAAKKDGSRYFGPYTNAGAVHETLRLLKSIFPLRSCKQTSFAKQDRPCLNAHIGRCAAPCADLIPHEDYHKMISEVIQFLEGRQESLVKSLKGKMARAAEAMQFEKAAELRDQIQALEMIIAKQKVMSGRLGDLDVLNYARGPSETCVQVFFIRGGKLLGKDHFFLEGTEGTENTEVLSSFLQQYYSKVDFIPGEILLPEQVQDQDVLQEWLSGKRDGKVEVKIPRQGEKKALLDLVGKNAIESLNQELLQRIAKRQTVQEALSEITEALQLTEEPQRIECYDISHVQGAETVASMVVFEHGRPSPSQYRRFKIKTVEGPDDFASMTEVIYRRFKKAQAGDDKFTNLPDLVIIDGGKGQLSAARAAMVDLGYSEIPAVGLAKENEWLFLENRSDPLILPRQSQGLYLLQRIRDEAHRFAVTYHRLLRGKRNLASALDDIPGIGPRRKEALLKHFGLSLRKIINASQSELQAVDGVSTEAARQVWEYFHPPEI